MNKFEVVNLIIRHKTHQLLPYELKDFINKQIEDGLYITGFEIAVKSGDLTHYEATDILNDLAVFFGVSEDEVQKALDIINEWSNGAELYLFCIKDNDYIVGDFIRFARYLDGKRLWISERVSIDGFKDLKIEGDKLIGKWYSPIGDNGFGNPWTNFDLNITDGMVKNGCGWDRNDSEQPNKINNFFLKIINLIRPRRSNA